VNFKYFLHVFPVTNQPLWSKEEKKAESYKIINQRNLIFFTLNEPLRHTCKMMAPLSWRDLRTSALEGHVATPGRTRT
jgi:hypothetical protein